MSRGLPAHSAPQRQRLGLYSSLDARLLAPLLLLSGAAVGAQGSPTDTYLFKEEFHRLREGTNQDVPLQCICAGRSCQDLARVSFYYSRVSTYVQRMNVWRNATGYQHGWSAEGYEALETERYGGSSIQLEYDVYGCDCSLCSASAWGMCGPHPAGCPRPLKSGEECAARCPLGTKPSQETLRCERGVLSPPAVWCHGDPPGAAPQAVRFVDADPLPRHVAGSLEVDLGERPWRMNATEVRVYFGAGTATIGEALLRKAVRWNEPGPVHLWLPRTAVPGGATSFLAYYANNVGVSSIPAVVIFLDLHVDPPQPEAGHPFDLGVLGGQTGAWANVRLDPGGSCGHGGPLLLPSRPSSPATFSVELSGVYAVCGCGGGGCLDDSSYGTLVGEVVVVGNSTVGLRGEGGAALSPVVGSPFILEVVGTGFGPGHRLRVLRAATAGGPFPTCGDTAQGDEDAMISGLHVEGRPDADSAGTSLRWQLVAYQSGMYQACLYLDLCPRGGRECSRLRRASATAVGIFHVRSCEPPCLTCYGHPRICSSCLDSSHVAQSGTCWPRSRWCAASANLSDVCEVGNSVTQIIGADVQPSRLVEDFQCASSSSEVAQSCPDCVMNRTCFCHGLVRFGFDATWTAWRSASGSVSCTVDAFGEDPLPGQEKVCMCRPSDMSAQGSLATPPSLVNASSVSTVKVHCPCSVKGLPAAFVAAQNYLLERTCEEEVSDCRSDGTPLRLVDPVAIAPLGSGALLVADRAHYVASSVPDRLIAAEDIPMGAVFRMDLASGDLSYACPACCSKMLYDPRSVRVAPSGAFWLIADSRNHRVRRVDTVSLEMTDLAGSGPQRCMDVYPDSSVVPTGNGGHAVDARLCRVADIAIHRDERRVLLAEEHCLVIGGPLEAGRVRLVDEEGLIQTVVSLPLVVGANRGGCTEAVTSIEWLPGEADRFVVACGRLLAFDLTGRDMTGSLFEGVGLQAVRSVRSALGGAELLLAGPGPAGAGALLELLPLQGGPARRVLWPEDALTALGVAQGLAESRVEEIPSALPVSDGSLLFLARQPGWTDILRVQPVCRPGYGIGDDGSCRVCPAGTYNDGSSGLFSRCAPCPNELEDSDAGAVQCGCLAGFKRANVTQPCEICQLGNYCPRGKEAAKRCPDKGMTFNGSHPGNYQAHSVSQCDCCFGQYRSGSGGAARPGQCVACPTGRWCSGSRTLQPDPQMRVQNGYWLPTAASTASAVVDESVTFKCAHPSHCWWTPYVRLWQASGDQMCREARKFENYNCSALHCAGVFAGAASVAAGAAASLPAVRDGCLNGRQGLACGRCAEGSYAPTPVHACRPCRDSRVQAAIGAAVLLISLGALCAALEACSDARRNAIYSFASIIAVALLFYEHLRVLHHLVDSPWSREQERIMAEIERGLSDTLSYIAPVSADCIASGSFVARRAVLSFSPLLVPLVLALLRPVAAAATAARRCLPGGEDSEGFGFSVGAAVNVLGLLACAFASPLTASALSFFQCYAHPGTGSSWTSLWASPAVLCSVDGEVPWVAALSLDTRVGEWQEALPVGVLGLAFPCAWLASQVMLMRQLPSVLLAHHGLDRESVGFLVRHRYSWRRLRSSARSWDLLTHLRTLILQFVVILEPLGCPAWAQIYLLFLVNLLALVCVVLYMPYTELVVNVFDGVSTGCMLLILSLAVMVLDKDQVSPDANDQITAAMVFLVLGFTLYVSGTAVRDLACPKRAATSEAAQIEDFARKIRGLAEAGCQVETGVLIDLISDLDPKSIREAQRSVHYLEQMMMPSSGRTSTEWTRLAALEEHKGEIDEELEQNFQEHGAVQAASMASKSSIGGIVAVLAGNSSSLGGNGRLVSERRKPSSRSTGGRASIMGHLRQSGASLRLSASWRTSMRGSVRGSMRGSALQSPSQASRASRSSFHGRRMSVSSVASDSDEDGDDPNSPARGRGSQDGDDAGGPPCGRDSQDGDDADGPAHGRGSQDGDGANGPPADRAADGAKARAGSDSEAGDEQGVRQQQSPRSGASASTVICI